MAEMVYLKAFFDWLTPLELLTDEEAGRLFRAALLYAKDGEEVPLSDRERLVFVSWMAQIDRDREQYSSLCENRAKAGRKGASARWKQHGKDSKSHVCQVKNGKCGKEKDKEEDKDKEEEKENKDICTQPQSASVPPVVELPLNDGSQYGVTEEQVIEWASLYPAVDVMQQLRNMKGWLLANPKKRKTKAGVLRFVTAWLSREQDKGGTLNGQQKRPEPLSGAGDTPEKTDRWGKLSVTRL